MAAHFLAAGVPTGHHLHQPGNVGCPRPPELLALLLTGCQADTAASYTFSQFRGSPKGEASAPGNFQPKLETIPTFFTLFIFGFLCHVILTWDALRLKNIIQIAGICITNVALLVYAAIQIGQIKDAVDDLVAHGVIQKEDIWDDIEPVLIAIACVMGILSLAMGANAWKLLQEFAWDIMKHIGADYRMKKRHVHYQVSSPSLAELRRKD